MKGNNNNHNCLTCKINYPFKDKINNYINCYETLNETEKIKCDNINDLLKLINKTKYEGKEGEIEYYDSILDNIENIFSNYYNLSILDEGNEEIIYIEKMTITLTTTENQKNNKDENVTIVNLGECEDLIRNNYNLKDKTLYIKKIDIIQEGMKIPKIEYDIYYNSGTSLKKLNISSICEKRMIYLLIPVKISESENIDELNTSSGYYNDICYSVTSKSGTDILLKDRMNEFIEENKTVCQDNCVFSEYNYSTQKVNCSCKIQKTSSSFRHMNIDPKNLFESFIDFKNIANINILGCVNTLFSISGIIKNIGSYILILIIILHIINIFIFYIKQKKKIDAKIKDIIFELSNIKIIEEYNNKSVKKGKMNRIKETENKKILDNFFDNERINLGKNLKKGRNNKHHKKIKDNIIEIKDDNNNNKRKRKKTKSHINENNLFFSHIDNNKDLKRNKNSHIHEIYNNYIFSNIKKIKRIKTIKKLKNQK